MTLCFGISARNSQAFVGRLSVFCPSPGAHFEELHAALILDSFYWVILSPHPVLLGRSPHTSLGAWIYLDQTEKCNTAVLIFTILIGVIV